MIALYLLTSLFTSLLTFCAATQETLHIVSHIEDPSCAGAIGLPGGVYMCPLPRFKSSATKKCQWFLPNPNQCYQWGQDVGSRPQSVGPDPGGYCMVFADTECKIRKQVALTPGGLEYDGFGCPGADLVPEAMDDQDTPNTRRHAEHSLNPFALAFASKRSGDPTIADEIDTLASNSTSATKEGKEGKNAPSYTSHACTSMSTPDTPPPRPRLPGAFCRYSSKLDESHGPLRTTSDGNLIEEESGDWLVLDTSPHGQEGRNIGLQKDRKASMSPTIGLPESKNGATGLDDPRARKPLARLIKNRWTGSDRLPAEGKDPVVTARKEIQATATQEHRQPSEKVDMVLLGKIQRNFGEEMAREFCGDWFEHALVDRAFWLLLLKEVSDLDIE
ncbi:hypothetical protein EJ02DRAFT_436812 [Clathrospora elynae]|uniref:Uncharacterized protein n=1 Tax=Clathrospora elynae TaxID=706981 RepID=A0A6A5SDX6_9PLEO|nr:hypothetical protein EJ02DRAFT_436812 [Clathrospora elynae]